MSRIHPFDQENKTENIDRNAISSEQELMEFRSHPRNDERTFTPSILESKSEIFLIQEAINE